MRDDDFLLPREAKLAEALGEMQVEVNRLRAEIQSLKWKPTKWWRAVTPEEELWCESSREKEVRERARPDDKIQRLWETLPNTEWRDED